MEDPPRNKATKIVDTPSVHDMIVAHQEPERPNFARLRAAFEKNQGRILEEYYALNFPAALLLVLRPFPFCRFSVRALGPSLIPLFPLPFFFYPLFFPRSSLPAAIMDRV